MTNAIKQKTIAISTNAFSVYLMIALIACSLVSYVYFVNKAVRNVTSLQKIESQSEVLVAKVSDLESEYFTARDEITISKAKQMGFNEAVNPMFISKSGATNSGDHLSINTKN